MYLERDDADEHAGGEEDEGLDEPDDAPHCSICATSVPSAEYWVREGEAEWTVPCEGQQPQISAKDDASDPFTFRAIVSSAGRAA